MGWAVNDAVALPPGKRLCAYFRAGWVDPRAGLEGCGKDKISWPQRGSNPGPSSTKRVAIPTTVALWACFIQSTHKYSLLLHPV
jgi:hypothetical protein